MQEDGEILLANRTALRCLVLESPTVRGTLQVAFLPGDIVILVNSALGADDGGLTP